MRHTIAIMSFAARYLAPDVFSLTRHSVRFALVGSIALAAASGCGGRLSANERGGDGAATTEITCPGMCTSTAPASEPFTSIEEAQTAIEGRWLICSTRDTSSNSVGFVFGPDRADDGEYYALTNGPSGITQSDQSQRYRLFLEGGIVQLGMTMGGKETPATLTYAACPLRQLAIGDAFWRLAPSPQ